MASHLESGKGLNLESNKKIRSFLITSHKIIISAVAAAKIMTLESAL